MSTAVNWQLRLGRRMEIGAGDGDLVAEMRWLGMTRSASGTAGSDVGDGRGQKHKRRRLGAAHGLSSNSAADRARGS
jgi:hypothetical protein